MVQGRWHSGIELMPWLAFTSALIATPGCGGPKVKTTDIPGPYERPKLIAVAPAMNFSGSSDFDPIQVADLFGSELTMVEGVDVVGVNRVMAVLSRQGTTEVGSPSQALSICETIGCDGIVVMAVTEYDPYTPVVGLAVQIYMTSPGGFASRMDPVAASRQASPFPIDAVEDSPLMPRAQVQRVYNGAHDTLVEKVRRFGEDRGGKDGALGWRRYLKRQRLYLRFCCWSAIKEMMGQEYHRQMAGAVAKE